MELSNFIVGKDILLLLPRFTQAIEYENLLLDYLSKRSIPREDIQIYKSLYKAVYAPQRKFVNIHLLEWGEDYSLVEELLSREKMNLLKVDFAKEYRGAKFRKVEIPLSGDMASWYKEVESSGVSDSVKSMVGNHHFANSPVSERVASLSQPEFNSRKLEIGREMDFSEGLSVNPRSPSLGHAHIDSIADVGTNDYQRSNREFALDSPKIFEVVKEYVSTPGKYVLVTSYTYLYGARFFKYLLSRVFTGTPLLLDALTSESKAQDVIRKYNNSSHNMLITTIVPPENLLGTTRVIVIDTYNVDLIVSILKKICSQGCGNEQQPLPVDLLYLKYFNTGLYSTIGSLVTHDQKIVDAAVLKLSQYEKEYEYLQKNATPVVISGDKFTVISPEGFS